MQRRRLKRKVLISIISVIILSLILFYFLPSQEQTKTKIGLHSREALFDQNQVILELKGLDESSLVTASESIEPTYIKGILLVNKNYGLPRDFGGQDKIAYDALQRLQEGAAGSSYSLPLLSGYRDFDYQTRLYYDYVMRDGQEQADTYSAKPGYSEHQTGLCFDIGAIDNNFGSTNEGKWLAMHAHEYGFIIRFPLGKEGITGYQYEPWHIRYVGEEAAKEIYEAKISLEEYLGVD